MGESGETLFEDARPAIEQALRKVAFSRRLGPADVEDLRSFAMLKLVENDYARLRKHSSSGSMTAYLVVVVHRLYLDLQVSRWGKWHPSVSARRRGATAVALERLVYRDGYELHEALEQLGAMEPVAGSRDDLLNLAYALPVRHRPHLVPEGQMYTARAAPVLDPVERLERDVRAKRLQRELAAAVAALAPEDRRILAMRFLEKRTVAQVASLLGVEAKPLYSRIRRLLDRVRVRLEEGGFDKGDIALGAVSVPELDLDGIFANRAA